MIHEVRSTSRQAVNRNQRLLEWVWLALLFGTLLPSTYYTVRAMIGLVGN